jgi:hypothetical protein
LYKAFFIFCFFVANAFAQVNLVPNPSFENYTACPNNASQITYASPWFQPSTGTPDYFNSCANPASTVSIPVNALGHQYAHSGNAYSGIIVFAQDYREYIEVPLTNTLVAGTKYYISFYVSLSDTCAKSTSTLGLLLTSFLLTANNYYPLPGTPQINNPSNVFFNYTNWTMVSGSYIATGGEKYITIGNFDSSSVTTELLLNSDTIHYNPEVNYLYIDDICVTTDSLYNNTWTGIEKQKAQTDFSIYPNPCSSKLNIDFSSRLPQRIIIYNLLGETVFEENKFQNRNIQIDVSKYQQGFYSVNVEYEGMIENKKLIIENP